MVYSNDSPMALSAMEDARLGGFDPYSIYDGGGADVEEVKEECPYCEAYKPELFYRDNEGLCLGCSECVTRVMTIRGLHT